jgi:type IV pilus assembly protein PilM
MLDFLDLKIKNFSLDINESSLKVVKIKTRKNSFSLVSFNEVKLQPEVIKDGIVQDEKALTASIRQVCTKVKGERLNTNYAIVSLPEEESFLQVIQMPKMSVDELKMAVALEAENYIPMPIDKAYFDFQVIAPIKDGLDHLDVLIVAMSKKIVNSYASCVKAAGLIPIAFEIESQAMARAFIKNETSDYPVIIIDIADNKLDFIIFSGNSVRYTTSVSFLTGDLATDSGMKENKNSLAIDELITQIKKYIDFYREHASHEHIPFENKVKKIIFSGGLANLKELADYISKKINIEAEVANPFINFPKMVESHNIASHPLSLAVALGLALRNFRKEYFLDND